MGLVILLESQQLLKASGFSVPIITDRHNFENNILPEFPKIALTKQEGGYQIIW